MNEYNPYAPPQAVLYKRSFPEMDFKTLKRLKNRSHTIRVFSLLWGGIAILGAIPIFAALVGSILVESSVGTLASLLSFLLFGMLALASYGASFRRTWGRTFGLLINFAYIGLVALWFIASVVEGNMTTFLLFFVLITIGFIGLFAFSEKSLFGDHKYLHRDLKEEYEYRKKDKQ